jgi:hypothetical protein
VVFDVSVALAWVMFLALFPITYFWLRRAWRILVRRDYSEVALKRGVAPADPRKFAPFEAAINLAAGTVTAGVIAAVALGAVDYVTWTSIAGSTIWLKLVASFILSRHAHLLGGGVRKP